MPAEAGGDVPLVGKLSSLSSSTSSSGRLSNKLSLFFLSLSKSLSKRSLISKSLLSGAVLCFWKYSSSDNFPLLISFNRSPIIGF